MALPILEEIFFKEFGQEYLEDVLPHSKIGKSPVYFQLQSQDKLECIDNLTALREVLRVLKMHPRFPYPIYIISTVIEKFDDFIVLKSEKDITSHFRIKSKRPNNREQFILNKVNLTYEKVTNLDIDQRYKLIRQGQERYEYLYKLSKESYYYEKILMGLTSTKKKL